MNESYAESFVKARQFEAHFEGLSAEQIRNLPAAEYARLTGRSLMPTASNDVSRPAPVVDHLDATRDDTLIEDVPGVSVRDMTTEQYAAYRKQIGMGQSQQYGRGILNAVSAPKASNGRHFMVNSNVEPSPAIARVSQVQVNEGNLDRRPLAERFGNASNAFRYE
jgi:hypothetical protein